MPVMHNFVIASCGKNTQINNQICAQITASGKARNATSQAVKQDSHSPVLQNVSIDSRGKNIKPHN